MPTCPGPEAPRVKSPYADASAQEAVRGLLDRHCCIVLGVVVALAVCAALITVQGPSIEGLVVYAAVCLCVSFAAVALNRRNFNRFLCILSADCNVRKMLEATSLLMEKRKRRREEPTYGVLYAMCSVQLGYDDIAPQWVDKVESYPKLSMSNGLSACNVRTVVARHRSDGDALANARGRLTALCSGGRIWGRWTPSASRVNRR
ncbi:hypothetical protein [Olsenella sp. Marseille-P4559]|uniref:hypothetical protein n=1 Tax=Olsenella sp. Marseille-P4559 TaxID=2364795 RepID=UPI001031FF5D|nr:hypothetical protein [Olsenella sp. Marseille-P4559]